MAHSLLDEHETESAIAMSSSSVIQEKEKSSVHRVKVPPRKNVVEEVRTTLREIFFADDPLRSFRGRSRTKKIALGFQAMFPILEWGSQYNYKKFICDLIAGLTLASLAIPQDIAYSNLAHLSPQYGLYTSSIPPFVYAVLGSSKDIAIGPVAVVSLLMGSLLEKEIDPKANPAAWIIWKIDKLDFIACLGAFLGVLFVSVEIGLLTAVSISLARIILHVMRPHTALLGNIPGTSLYRNMEQYPEAVTVPGVVITTIDSAIYFSNSNYVRERYHCDILHHLPRHFTMFPYYHSQRLTSKFMVLRILRWLSDEQEKAKEMGQARIQFLVIEMSAVFDVDTSAIHALEELHRTLKKREVHVCYFHQICYFAALTLQLQASQVTNIEIERFGDCHTRVGIGPCVSGYSGL